MALEMTAFPVSYINVCSLSILIYSSWQVQREGMRLFLIWYQILMDNATEECHATYKSLVLQLGTSEGLSVDMFTVRSSSSSKCSNLFINLAP